MITWHNLNASDLQFHFFTDQYLYCHAMTLPDTKRHEIDTPTKNRIIGHALETGNAAQAGRDENVNPRTAQRIVKRYQKIGSTSNKPRPRRPQKLNHYDKHHILQTALKQRRAPFQVITKPGLTSRLLDKTIGGSSSQMSATCTWVITVDAFM